MGRRSPMNERYQKHTAPAGKTRKSAAAAKPKRAAGTESKGSSAKRSAAKTVRTRRGQAAFVHPTTPEYKRMRTIWWILLGISIVLSILSMVIWWLVPSLKNVGNYVIAIAYVFIFAAIYVDWAKLRPLRNKWMQSGQKAAEKELGDSAAKTDSSKPGESPGDHEASEHKKS